MTACRKLKRSDPGGGSDRFVLDNPEAGCSIAAGMHWVDISSYPQSWEKIMDLSYTPQVLVYGPITSDEWRRIQTDLQMIWNDIAPGSPMLTVSHIDEPRAMQLALIDKTRIDIIVIRAGSSHMWEFLAGQMKASRSNAWAVVDLGALLDVETILRKNGVRVCKGPIRAILRQRLAAIKRSGQQP